MELVGIHVERQHHEVATAGQAEIDIRFDSLVKCADNLHVVQVHHQERGPPARQDRDLHAEAALRRQRLRHALHQSIWKGGKPLFAGEGYAGLSELAMYYIGGILKHARRSPRSATPRRTATSGWSPGSRRR